MVKYSAKREKYMKKVLFVVFLAGLATGAASAMNATANLVRACEGVFVANADNYVLRCPKSEKFTDMQSGFEQFFAADNGGDERGAFIDLIPDNADYVYVNVVSNLADARYKDQTCYRFITKKDATRDGYYATEVCEYDRPDYYL